MKVIGGSGRFVGATGSATLKTLGESGGQGRYGFEVTMTTP